MSLSRRITATVEHETAIQYSFTYGETTMHVIIDLCILKSELNIS